MLKLTHVYPARTAFILAGSLCLLTAAPDTRAQLSGNATLTSDYVWRGSSQTQEDPAAQFGLKYTTTPGFYATAWGSNVEFAPALEASSEFDFSIGWAGAIAPEWALDLYLLRYQYPSTTSDLNWNELNASLTWRSNYWLAVAYSDDAMASDTDGTYVLLGARYPYNDQLRLEGTVAHYFLDHRYADSYSHGTIGAIWAFKSPFEACLTLHGTDSKAKQLFPDMAGTRVEFAVQASF